MLSANAASPDERNVRLGNLVNSVKDGEGNTYRTVKIGEQIWLAENLRSTRYQDGSPIKTGFIPKDDEKNLLKYGRLYDWHDVADERNLCPAGWRVATDDDWKVLERTIGMPAEAINGLGWRGDNLANSLKASQPDTLFRKFDQSQVNLHQFSARPAGVKWRNWYITQGMYSEFWTSSEASKADAYNRTLAHAWWNMNNGAIRRTTISKDYMFSVRCIKA